MNALRHILAPIAGVIAYTIMMVLAPYIRSLLNIIYSAAMPPNETVYGWGACLVSMALAVIVADLVSMIIAPNKQYIGTITIAIVSTAAMILAMTIGVDVNIIASIVGTTIANIAMVVSSLSNKKLK